MIYAIVTVLVLIADQLLKYWTVLNISLNVGSKPLIPGVVSLVYIQNTGAAFGLMPGKRFFFIIIAAAFIAFVVFALAKGFIKAPLGRWSAVLVMAGAIGNCIDRVMNGYVVDMFKLEFWNFAIFNLADIFITVCGVLFCIYIIFGKDDKHKAAAEGSDDDYDKPRSVGRAKVDSRTGRNPRVAEDEDVRGYEPRSRANVDDTNPFARMEDLTATGKNPARTPTQRTPRRTEPVRVPPKYTADEIASARAAVAGKDPARFAADPSTARRPAAPRQAPVTDETGRGAPIAEDVPAAPVSGSTLRRPAPPAGYQTRSAATAEPTRRSAGVEPARRPAPIEPMRRPTASEPTRRVSPVAPSPRSAATSEPTSRRPAFLDPTARRPVVSSTQRRPAVSESTMRRPVVSDSTARRPAPAPKPKDPMDFSLDDILAEFGDK